MEMIIRYYATFFVGVLFLQVGFLVVERLVLIFRNVFSPVKGGFR